MRKLILTLFLASASLVSFAQSTVKTIRVADATPATIGVDIPVGTLVIDVDTKDLYIATAGVLSSFTITTALAESTPLLLKVNGSVYSVIDEAVGGGTSSIKVANSQPADGADVTIVASDFKVYVNGTLLLKSAYTVVADAGAGSNEAGIEIAAGIYEYDQVSVVYNTIK
ncbi:MAG: hypothetical protein ACKVJW_07055 [Flavobacteriales bacterium]